MDEATPADEQGLVRPEQREADAAHAQQSLGDQFAALLRQTCDGRLGEINWFRTDWQRGGALTGYATYTADETQPRNVVVKLPVKPRERDWLLRLQSHENVAPRLYAHGQTLGPYDIVWVVMECLPHGPLGPNWRGGEFDLLVEAAGRFYAATRHTPLSTEHNERDYPAIYELARKHLGRHDLRHEQRWKEALKRVHRKLDTWIREWRKRPIQDWCHGDLHLANAMARHAPPEGPAVLLDLAEVHAGHWVEDAVYFEHLFWARPQRLAGRRLASMIAHERKRLGLTVHDDWPRYAQIKRALLAMSVPAMLDLDGGPHHVEASLHVLESIVGSSH